MVDHPGGDVSVESVMAWVCTTSWPTPNSPAVMASHPRARRRSGTRAFASAAGPAAPAPTYRAVPPAQRAFVPSRAGQSESTVGAWDATSVEYAPTSGMDRGWSSPMSPPPTGSAGTSGPARWARWPAAAPRRAPPRVRRPQPRLPGPRRGRTRPGHRRVAWWAITERMPRRAVGIAGAALGVAAIVVALVRATPGGRPRRPAAGAPGRAPGRGRRPRAGGARPRPPCPRRAAPGDRASRHPVLICNPWSGGGKVEQFGLADLAGDWGGGGHARPGPRPRTAGPGRHRPRGRLPGDGRRDGSQALVASIAIEHDLPFVCVSAGTRNHFALDLGIDREDPEGAWPPSVTASNGASTTPRSATGSSSTTCRSASTPPSCSRRATARPSRRPPGRSSPRCWAGPRSRSTSSSPTRTGARSTVRS